MRVKLVFLVHMSDGQRALIRRFLQAAADAGHEYQG